MSSEIPRPSYQTILDELSTLAARDPTWVTLIDYGLSTEGRPLRAVKLQDPGHNSGPGPHPAVLITGNTHGNEYLHIEDRLPSWLIANHEASLGVQHFFASGGVVLVVPVVNPDGFSSGRRENSHGVDLNRDFDQLPLHENNFHEVETRQLAQWLDHELQTDHLLLRMTVDYHCCSGSLLYPWSYRADAGLSSSDQAAFASVGRAMQESLGSNYRCGITSELLGYSASGTSKDYYYAKYHALALTFEGRRKDEEAKFPQHAQWWNSLLGYDG